MESLSVKTTDVQPVTPGTAASADEDSPTSPAGHEFPTVNRQGAISISPDQPVATTASGAPALNPRSCVTCRRRKVRCDKQMPCSNCRRAQITCLFPAPGRAPRRPRPKDPNAPPKNSTEREVELIKRLRKLEGIVEELSGQIEVDSGSNRQNSSAGNSPEAVGNDCSIDGVGNGVSPLSPTAANNALREALASKRPDGEPGKQMLGRRKQSDVQKQFGRLVLHDKGRTSRYVSSAFWAKLNDELDELRAETHALSEGTDESGDEATPDTSPKPTDSLTDHHSFIFGYSSTDVDLRRLHPLPSQIPFMWQVYLENVEPLMKILHIPTMEKMMRDMRKNIDDLTPGNEALLFSIYYAAITSMEDEEVQKNFGSQKVQMLNQYRFALEQALAKANFINTSDIVVLKAFVLFLTIVRRQDDTRFCWTLTGLVIRIAQGLGIHRDGSHFDLSPFQIEMRRRLWWAICALDLRSAEELGTDLTIVNSSFDTELPSNINDTDIDPETKEMPISRVGRTDCAVALVRYEICGLSRRLHTASSAMATVCPRDAASTLEDRERMLIEVYDRVEEKFLKHCINDDDPLFWMAAMVARVIMAKMGLVIYQPMLFPGDGPGLSTEIRDRLFISAIEIVEYNHILNTDHRCRQWRWLFQTYRQWHAVAYILMEVCRRPWTATSERGWEAVNGVFNSEGSPIDHARMADHTAVWIPLRRLLVKAKKHREAEVTRLRAHPEAAHQLDVEDRLNPLPARLGPVPGMEHKLTEQRRRWRKLVRSDGASPMPPLHASLAQPSGENGSVNSPPVSGQPPTVPAGAPLPTFDLPADKESALMDTIMHGNYNVAELWPYAYAGPEAMAGESGNGLYANTARTTPQPISVAASPAMSGRSAPAGGLSTNAEEMLKQQAMAFHTQPGAQAHRDPNPPPWLWSDPFTAMNSRFDDVPVGEVDVNMDSEDINWQNWQQSLKDFEGVDPGNGGGTTKLAW